jgi:hypothetical protein
MGAPIYGRYELFRELRKIIDLPDGILDMEIRMPPDEIPTITVVMAVKKLVATEPLETDHVVYHNEVSRVTKRFRLEEIEPAK